MSDVGINPLKFSFVICNGRSTWPVETISSITSESVLRDYEVIVCGANISPDDDTANNVVTLFRECESANKKRNAGARKATGRYLVFLDDDVLLKKGWRRCFESIYIEDLDAAHGTVFVGDGLIIDDLNENGLLIKKSIFQEVTFDECLGPGALYGSSEALDLKLRLTKRGISLHKRDFGVLHPPLLVDQTLKKTLSYSVGNGFVLRKHGLHRVFLYQLIKSTVRVFWPFFTPYGFLHYLVRALGLLSGYLSYESK